MELNENNFIIQKKTKDDFVNFAYTYFYNFFCDRFSKDRSLETFKKRVIELHTFSRFFGCNYDVFLDENELDSIAENLAYSLTSEKFYISKSIACREILEILAKKDCFDQNSIYLLTSIEKNKIIEETIKKYKNENQKNYKYKIENSRFKTLEDEVNFFFYNWLKSFNQPKLKLKKLYEILFK